MAFHVSTLLHTLDFLLPHAGEQAVHGANLSIWEFVRWTVRSNEVQRLEVFLPPALMTDRVKLGEAAVALLPPEMMGKGRLSFYPVHSIPEVWADGKPRILRSIDPEVMARDRYLRDRFSEGPMALSVDTHQFGKHATWIQYEKIAGAPAVPYDSIVSLSNAHANATVKAFKTMFGCEPPCRIDVVGRPVDTERLKPVDQTTKRSLRRELDWPLDDVIVLYLARVTAYGKADLGPLVRAFSETEPQGATLVIAGAATDDRALDRIRGIGEECGLGHRLIVFGGVPPSERHKLFQAADVYALPSDTIQESFGVSTLEAMAAGLPVITADWDGFKDYVVDGTNGFLIPTFWMPGLDRVSALSPASTEIADYLFTAQSVSLDRSLLAKRLIELTSNEDTRNEMGARAREQALNYRHEQIAGKTIAIWLEQLKEAAAESADARLSRRNAANEVGAPTPYLELFEHYATDMLSENSTIRLSPYGKRMIAGEIPLGMYDETTAITHGELLQGILEMTAERGEVLLSLGELASKFSKGGLFGLSDVLFHAALLIKADAIDVVRH